MKNTLMLTIGILLLIVNWLTFHDIFEQHTMRDWLTLFTSALIFFYFAQHIFRNISHK